MLWQDVSKMNGIDRNHPFLPLCPKSDSDVSNMDKTKEYVLNLESYNNPAVFYFDDVFESVKSIEVLKTRIERSEHTCEYYRNCPFITLFNNFPSYVSTKSIKEITYQLGISNMNASGLLSYLDACMHDFSTKSFKLQRTFFYNYKTSSLSTVWWQSPDLWDSYTNNWYLSDLWGSFNLGIAPYVLDNENYTIDTLTSTLNDISNAYYLQMQGHVPLILTGYNSDLNRFYFYSTTVFFLFPSNACDVVGLREDSIYISQYNYTTNYFTVYADHAPKLKGADVIFIENEESKSSLKNPLYTSLSTVYLPDETFYPYLNFNKSYSFVREVQMINKRVNKLTISMYSDIINKFLYQNNDTKWNIQLLIKGII